MKNLPKVSGEWYDNPLIDKGCRTMYMTYVLLTDTGVPFYAGAGDKNRIDRHLRGAGGRSEVNKVIGEHHRRGTTIGHRVVKWFDLKDDAFAHEVELIRQIGKISDGGTLVNICDGGAGVTGYRASESQRLATSQRNIERFSDPAERKRTSDATIAAMADPTIRSVISEKLINKWQDPSYRSQQVESHTGHRDTDETKALKAAKIKSAWNDGTRRGKYTDEEISVVYNCKGMWSVEDTAAIYGMNPTYVHKIWRHERCRMALQRLGIIS
jgi:hypothetical protein